MISASQLLKPSTKTSHPVACTMAERISMLVNALIKPVGVWMPTMDNVVKHLEIKQSLAYPVPYILYNLLPIFFLCSQIASRDDFCISTPQTFYKDLPPGCTHNGRTDFDVGKCPESACRGLDADSGQCAGDESYCCGPTEYVTVEVDCGDLSPVMNVITTCGCR